MKFSSHNIVMEEEAQRKQDKMPEPEPTLLHTLSNKQLVCWKTWIQRADVAASRVPAAVGGAATRDAPSRSRRADATFTEKGF